MERSITVFRLGRVEYADGLRLQELFGEARKQELIGDVLLLLEHSPVLTLGRAAKKENILAGPDALERLGVDVFETNRGGDVTYHGPGQVVGYPIFKLQEGRKDVRRYVRDIEEAMIRTVADFGLQAGRIPKWTGVWMGEETDPDARKIAAIGVHISRWQTSHGFALNVNTDLSHFGLIIPCGIKEKGVTSISRELDRPVTMSQVEDALAKHFSALFDAPVQEAGPMKQTVSVAVTRGAGANAEALVLRRRPERGGFWQIVTGRIEDGESPAQAAAREVHEELGLPLEVRPLDYVHAFAFGDEAPPHVFQETAFAARWPEGHTPSLSHEHDAYEWLPVRDAVARLPFAGLKVAVRRAGALP